MTARRAPDERLLRRALVAVPAFGLAAGFLALSGGAPGAAHGIFAAATAPVLLVLLRDVGRGLRRGEFGLDLVAALSMGGALALGEPLAGAIVALMFAGGQLLEAFARERARREMTALLGRVARTAVRHGAGGLEEVALDALRPGDRLLIRRGEVVPVDGRVVAQAEFGDSPEAGANPVRVAVDGAFIKTQTVPPLAETAAKLFWALLASGQTSRRKADGWQSLGQPPANSMIDLAA